MPKRLVIERPPDTIYLPSEYLRLLDYAEKNGHSIVIVPSKLVMEAKKLDVDCESAISEFLAASRKRV